MRIGLANVPRRGTDVSCDDAQAVGRFAVVATGYAGGEVPLGSRLASTLLAAARGAPVDADRADYERVLADAIRAINAVFHEEAKGADWDYGATFAAVWLRRAEMLVVHAGSCSVARLRRGTWTTLAEPHTLVARMVREGHLTHEQAASFEHRHVVLNAIGTRPEPRAEFAWHSIEANDRIVVATGGVDLFDTAVRRSVELTDDPTATAAVVCERASASDDAACVVILL